MLKARTLERELVQKTILESRRETCVKICLQWSFSASKKNNKRAKALQSRIDTLYHRYTNSLITVSNLLNGLSSVVAKTMI
jgi:hypothetical protein